MTPVLRITHVTACLFLIVGCTSTSRPYMTQHMPDDRHTHQVLTPVLHPVPVSSASQTPRGTYQSQTLTSLPSPSVSEASRQDLPLITASNAKNTSAPQPQTLQMVQLQPVGESGQLQVVQPTQSQLYELQPLALDQPETLPSTSSPRTNTLAQPNPQPDVTPQHTSLPQAPPLPLISQNTLPAIQETPAPETTSTRAPAPPAENRLQSLPGLAHETSPPSHPQGKASQIQNLSPITDAKTTGNPLQTLPPIVPENEVTSGMPSGESETPPADDAATTDTTVSVPPPASARPTRPQYHVLQRGQTLWSLAKRYYHNPKRWIDIARLNHIHRPDRIRIGTRLKLP